jgi:chorismate synthase
MSSFGTLFKVSTFGESHGKGVGCIVDGVPPNLDLSEEDIQPQLTRRRPGQSTITTARAEFDQVTILSGVEFGKTLGTPIAMVVYNEDQRKHDYANTDTCPRPGHAEYTYMQKYNCKASSGGGRASARETIARVAAGALAEKWLKTMYGTTVVTWVSQVSDICIPKDDAKALEDKPPTREDIDKLGCVIDGGEVLKDADGNCYDKTGKPIDKVDEVEGALLHTRCPHPRTAVAMAVRIKELRAAEDSTGGVATTVITKVPVGLGEPVFDKAEAELAKAMISLPATKGFEIGEGFACAAMNGSHHNDLFVASGKDSPRGRPPLLDTATNHAGGTLGGITTGKNIVMRVAIKPASSIAQPQETAKYNGESSVLEVKGRHDPCVLPRCPPLLEGMSAITIADLVLRQRSRVDAPLVTLDF